MLGLYAEHFPQAVLGLSDHTPGHVTAVAAVALGARVIEKHFTDDRSREGPDHGFAMTPATWRDLATRPIPADGLAPYRAPELAGRALRRAVDVDELVRLADLEA